MTDPRGSQAWKRLRRQVVIEEPICWLKLEGCSGQSTTADHIQPVSSHPELALVRANLRGACKSCNRKRGGFPVDRMTSGADRPAWCCSVCNGPLEAPALLIFHPCRGAVAKEVAA